MELIPIRRYVNADNSCLFSSIAYLINKNNFNENSGLIYRLMIVDYIKEGNISQDILGVSKDEYILKMADIKSWGGAIELKLFSDLFEIEIASLDVMSGRLHLFGETKNYNKRIYVMYNGVHYDPLIMNFDESAETETDITIFDSDDDDKLIMFKDYIESIKARGDYVDPSKIQNFQCSDCQDIFTNEHDVMKHAEQNNHWNFAQI